MIFLSRLLQLRNRKDSERGLTLTELLVAMGLLVLVAGVALAILLSTTSSSTRFGQNTANQTEVANAINIINRDIAVSSSTAYASNTALTLRSQEDSVQYTVKLFGYDPSKADKGLPQGYTVNTGNLPTFPAIIEQRQADGSSTMTQNVLVPGWVIANQSTPLFSYFDQSDSQLQPDSGGNASIKSLGDIRRIEFFISAKVSDRSSNIELAGSATPNSFSAQGIGCSSSCVPPVPIAPVLRGTLTEGERTAHLTWEVSAGATSYTLYRKTNGGAYEVRAIISDPDTKKFDDSQSIDWGNIYTYYIVAFGSGGVSANSNEVPLTVVPDKVNIVNINTKANLSDVYPGLNPTTNPVAGYTYTVARNLTNQITWQQVYGATGYYVFKDGATTPMATVDSNVHSVNDSYVDCKVLWPRWNSDQAAQYAQCLAENANTNVDYGKVHSYTVQAFNQGSNCIVTVIYPRANVCDGKVSDSVALISPPTKPSISASNDGVNNRDSQPTNTVTLTTRGNSNGTNVSGYDLYSNSQRSIAGDCSNLNGNGQSFGLAANSKITNNVNWGTSTCYGAKAYNDAGNSPMSDPATAEQGPSSFGFQNVNSKAPIIDGNGTRYTVARDNTNQLVWNESFGADNYRIYRDNQLVATVGGDVRVWSESAPNGDNHTYYIVSVTNHNGLTYQSGSVQLISPPTAPQISAVANDDSTASKSVNYVYVNNYGTNTASVTVYRAQQAAANPQCSTDNSLTNNANGTNGDGNADWGSSTCYVARAYNDAGSSPLSNTATANQLPGKFGFNAFQNTRNYLATYAEGFAGLNNTSNNNNDDVTPSRNQSLAYTLGWGNSLGSNKYNLIYGYKKDNSGARNDWSGNSYSVCGAGNTSIMNSLMPSSTVSNTNCFKDDGDRSTATSLKTQNLSPGSYYRAVAIAVGNNGTRRGTSSEFATTPTIPKFTSTYSYKRQVNNASKNGTSYMARVANVSLATTFGAATSVRAYYDWNDGADGTTRGSGVANPTWYSRSASQGTNDYVRVRTSGHDATQASLNKNTGLCRQVSGNFCDVFNTNYDSSGAADTTRGDLTNRYNSNRFSSYNGSTAPPNYQWGNGDTLYATGGAQTYLSAPSYNYSGYSDQITWEGGISESNCYYLACNPNNTDVAPGPWAGYSYNEYVPNGDTNHAYYFMSGAQDNINPSNSVQGNPPAAATGSYATGSASTSDGSLPDNNVVVSN